MELPTMAARILRSRSSFAGGCAVELNAEIAEGAESSGNNFSAFSASSAFQILRLLPFRGRWARFAVVADAAVRSLSLAVVQSAATKKMEPRNAREQRAARFGSL